MDATTQQVDQVAGQCAHHCQNQTSSQQAVSKNRADQPQQGWKSGHAGNFTGNRNVRQRVTGLTEQSVGFPTSDVSAQFPVSASITGDQKFLVVVLELPGDDHRREYSDHQRRAQDD